MKHELYELYQQCFPNEKVSREAFLDKLDYDHSDVIIEQEHSKIAAALVMNENTVLLLCVAPWARGKGYGRNLLQSAEAKMAEQEYDKVVLGHGRSYLFPGVPYGKEEDYHFFEKLGYHADWSSVDMEIDLTVEEEASKNLKKVPDQVQFRILPEGRKKELFEAVNTVQENWNRYFKTTKCPIAVAVKNDKIVGFEMIYKQVSENTVKGYVGCVGVIPSERGQGIGLAMVSYGLQQLKREEIHTARIEYTHLESWYAKLGAVTVQRYWMGEKLLKQQ